LELFLEILSTDKDATTPCCSSFLGIAGKQLY
jgi:hypothetical protein